MPDDAMVELDKARRRAERELTLRNMDASKATAAATYAAMKLKLQVS